MSVRAASSSFKDWSMAKDYPALTGPRVLSLFHCGGGSTMGYKLAGCRVLGGVDIDPKMSALYKANHKPSYQFGEGVIEFNKREASQFTGEVDILDGSPPCTPFSMAGQFTGEVDILDGSPPCTPFSMAGEREDSWGKEKRFQEGQATQRLDDLFFNFIDTARIIRPKAVVAENVKGMILGKARGYTKEIVSEFQKLGYECRVHLLCASRFGVPQRRERVFFVATQKGAPAPYFEEVPGEVHFSEIDDGDVVRKPPYKCDKDAVASVATGGDVRIQDYFQRVNGKGKLWNHVATKRNAPLQTVGTVNTFYHPTGVGHLTDNELRKAQSFPFDYDFIDNKVQYVTGMSVPPLLMKAVALGVRRCLDA